MYLIVFLCVGSLLVTTGCHGSLRFTVEPPDRLDFINSAGAALDCAVLGEGERAVRVEWQLEDGSSVAPVPGLRQIVGNRLLFPAFRAENFRMDVHSTVYTCFAALSPFEAIRSRSVRVNGVVIQQMHDIQVYDSYVIERNTAVLRCHIPPTVQQYYKVTDWILNENTLITQHIRDNGDRKFSVLPNGDLHIFNTTIADSGSKYKCKTTNSMTGESEISSGAGQLYVTESRGMVPPKITDTNINVEIDEGDLCVIPCVAQGNPVPTVKWFKKNSYGQLTPLLSDSRFAQTTSSLTIKNVQVSDEGVFVCKVQTAVANVQMTANVTVYEKLLAQVVPTRHNAKKNDRLSFTCEVTGHPITSIAWLHNGIIIRNANDKILTIERVQTSNKGIYQCMVKNQKQMVHSLAELQLSEIAPEITEVFKEMILRPKASMSLKCKATGTPIPTIEWTVDRVPLVSDLKIKINTKQEEGGIQSILNINSLVVEDGGLYSCVASNKGGKSEHSARVNVYGNLGIREVPQLIAVSDNKFYLNCPYYGYPIQEIRWLKDDNDLPNDMRQTLFNNGTLMINDVDKLGDSGEYICVVKNNIAIEGHVDVKVLVPPKIIPFEFQDELLREGMRARLQCVISEGDLPLKVLWWKDGNPITSEMGIFVKALDEFSTILTINHISPKHNGEYTCVASNNAATVIHTAHLSVNVAPKIVPFSFQGDHVFEGALARLTCVVYQGDLPLKISWLKDFSLLIPPSLDIKIRSVDTYTSILTIDQVEQKHQGNYTCVAENKAASASHTAVLVVNVPPKIVPFEFNDEQTVEGQLARVSCIASRGDLPLKFYWEKDGVELKFNEAGANGIQARLFDEHSSILSIASISAIHNGHYDCIVSNAAGTARHSAHIVVKVPPKWIHIPTDIAILNKEFVIAHCQVDGFPQPKIVWKYSENSNNPRSSKNVQNDGTLQVFPNGSLSIRQMASAYEGSYICQASNGIGKGLNRKIQIKINAPPTFVHPLSIQKVNVSSDAELHCSVHGDSPIKVSWFIDEKIIQDGQKRYKMKFSSTTFNAVSTLTVLKSTREDNGNYTCRAENVYGSNQTAIELFVLESPDSPNNLKATNIGSRNVELLWSSTYSGNDPVKKYLIQYKETSISWEKAVLMETVNGVPTNSIISQLKPSTTYMFRIFAENSIGRSSASQILRITTDEDLPTSSPVDVQVEPINAETFKVMWKAPNMLEWNGRILGYNIGYKEVDTEDPYIFKTLVIAEPLSANMFVHIGGLKQFTKYAVTVLCYNSKGKGPMTEPVIVMTSEGAPTVSPEDVRCTTLTSQSVHVTWSAVSPDSINGILRGYKILYRPASDWLDEYADNFNITLSTSTTLTQLDKFSNYSIQVVAMTRAGIGPRSQPVFCKTLDDTPNQPSSVKVIPSSEDSIVVAWKKPDNPNGVIKAYTVYWQNKDTNKGIEKFRVNENVENYEVSGLQKNKYEFWVTASTMAGEGPPSKPVIQTPMGPTLPAKLISFDNKISTSWKSFVSLPCIVIAKPEASRKWTFRNQMIAGSDRVHVNDDGTLLIKEVLESDAGDYICSVSNDHGNDKITYTITVFGPPDAPTIDITSITSNSLEVQWKAQNIKTSRIKGFSLHLRKDGGEWNDLSLSADVRSYKLSSLECGTRYEMYMSAHNRLGVGAASPVQLFSTNGSVPTSPMSEELLETSSNSVSLYLNSWKSNECPIQYYVVEYASLATNHWVTVSEYIKPEQRRLVIPNLRPATWYSLRMTAHNSAGSTIAKYDFATLTNSGATISPDLQSDAPRDKMGGLMATLNFYVIIPISCTIVILFAIFAFACLWLKLKKRDLQALNANRMSVIGSEIRRGDSTESFSYLQRELANRQAEEAKYGPEDITPYATLQLPGSRFQTTLRRHGNTLVSGDGVMYNHQFIIPQGIVGFVPGPGGPMETTFIFPPPPPEVINQSEISQNPTSYQNDAINFD